jgi:peptidoglycan/LPS O-acetylase OafA/YrhL
MRTFGMRLPLRYVSPNSKNQGDADFRVATVLKPDRNSFGVVRLVLALAVLVSHSFWFTSGSSTQEPLYSWTGWTLGEHAVQVFFILSGILVAQSFARSGSVVQFALARCLRIFPGLIICVLATSLVLGLVITTFPPRAYLLQPQLWIYQLKTALLITAATPLPGVFDTNPVPQLFNGSLWTLKYEVICYGLLGFLGAVNLFHPALRRTSIVLVSLFIAACAWMLPSPIICPRAAIAAGTCVHAFTPAQNIAIFAMTFFTGVLLYFLRERLVLRWSVVGLLLIVAAGTIGTRWQNLTNVMLLGYATLTFARVSYGNLTTWTRDNDLSFGLYIYAAPIQQAIVHTIPGIDPLMLSLGTIAVAFPCALLSWRLIEQPALRLKTRLRPGGEAAAYPSQVSATVGLAAKRVAPPLVISATAPPVTAATARSTPAMTGPDVAARLRLNPRTGPASESYRPARGSLRVA